jgi:DNA-binding PadR family transcriptional regulator
MVNRPSDSDLPGDDIDPRALPTTSYAVLGLLALRDWTGYELAHQFQRSLRYCWPKAESVLYEEPRRLARAGLAEIHVERRGGRARNRYRITTRGRMALARWLAVASAPPHLEIEPMVRLLFADQGSTDDLRRTVQSLRAWSEENIQTGIPQLQDYVTQGGPFPNRNHISVLLARYFADLYDLTIAWCDLVDAELDTWGDTADIGMTDSIRAMAIELVERYRVSTVDR